jgi:hypothetical protein
MDATKNFAALILAHAAGDLLPNIVPWVKAFHEDLCTWWEQRCLDVIPNKTVQPSEQLGLIPKLASLRQSRRSEPYQCRPRPDTPGSE